MSAPRTAAAIPVLTTVAIFLLAGCSGNLGAGPGPIVTDPPGALDDLGWIPCRILLFADRNKDGVLNAAEQQDVRDEVMAREMCEDRYWCF